MGRLAQKSAVLSLLLAATLAHAQSDGWSDCRSRSPQTAIAGCTAVISSGSEANTGMAVAYNNRGVAQGRIGRFDLAIEDFTQSISLTSNFIGWTEEGAASWVQDKVQNSAASTGILSNDVVSDATPDAALFYKNRGVAYYRTGKYAKAIQDFTDAMSHRRNYLEAMLDRGIAHADANEPDAAIDDYNAAMEMKPDDPAPYIDRGALYVRREKYDAAIADYTRAITLRPDSAAAYGGRCMAQAIAGKLQPAIADCNAALDISPSLAMALEARGFVDLKLGDYAQARNDYAAAVKSANDPESLYGRGMAEQMLGYGDDAENDITAAQKVDANIADEFARWGISAMRNATQPAPQTTNGSPKAPAEKQN